VTDRSPPGAGSEPAVTDPKSRCAANTDRELWREPPGDYYSNLIFVTEGGGIGIDVGGHVIVMQLAAWHALARPALEDPDRVDADRGPALAAANSRVRSR